MHDVAYERRLAAADALLPAFVDGESSNQYFTTAVLPNLLPERYVETPDQNVTWIGHRQAESFYKSAAAFTDLLRYLINMDELDPVQAVDCADALDLDWPLTRHLERATECAIGEATLYLLHVTENPAETQYQLTSVAGSLVSCGRPALRLVR